MAKFKEVFDAHPDTDEIYVVGEMPFLKKSDAESYANSVKEKMATVKREKKKSKGGKDGGAAAPPAE